jgi:hypothetical protein
MNSKAEWNQPVVARVVVSRELEKLEVQGAGGGGARGRSIRLSLVGQSESVLKEPECSESLVGVEHWAMHLPPLLKQDVQNVRGHWSMGLTKRNNREIISGKRLLS